jgi:hypothetical protein
MNELNSVGITPAIFDGKIQAKAALGSSGQACKIQMRLH